MVLPRSVQQIMYGLTLWQVNTPWCDRLVDFHTYVSLCERGLSLMRRFYAGESLSPDDIAFLVEQGLLRHTVPGGFSPAVAALRGGKIRDALLELGRRVRSGHRDALRPYVQRYRQALLDRTPPQMLSLIHIFCPSAMETEGLFLLPPYFLQTLNLV